MQEQTEAAILGAGAAGICLGAKLSRAGIPYLVLEKASSVGGTWRENVYPGSGCDVVSHLYSFSFAQKPDWTRRFAKQAEIRDYFEECAERFGVMQRIRFAPPVTGPRFNAADKSWMVETADGRTVRARTVVSAVGQLNRPFKPDLPGASFEGPSFHSAEWDHAVDLEGKRVAVIASGASAIQFVPEIVPRVANLTPDYPAGCKRILLSNDWFKTLARENVEVVPRQAVSVEYSAVVDSAGLRHAADVLIYATGFEAHNFLPGIDVRGRGGRDLRETWRDRPTVHRGMAAPGFPNIFMLYGPNTNLNHGSILFMLECMADYILRCVKLVRSRRIATLEPWEEATAGLNAALQAEMKRTVWVAGCSSWYKAADGTVLNNWSSYTVKYWWQTCRPRLAEYQLA